MYISLNCDKDRHVQVKFKYFAALVQTMQRWQQDEEKEKGEQCDLRQEISPPCQPQQGLVVRRLDDLASRYQIEKELGAKPGCRTLMASCKASGDRFLVTERTKPPPSAPTALDPLGDPPVPLEVCCMIRLLSVPGVQQICAWHETKGCLYTVVKWEDGMVNLRTALLGGRAELTAVKIKAIFRSLVQTVCGIFSRDILYTDLKTDNILVSESFLFGEAQQQQQECSIMLTDFSNARLHKKNLFAYRVRGREQPTPPEFKGRHGICLLDGSSLIYQLGLILLEMTGKELQHVWFTKNQSKEPAPLCPSLTNLLQKCLRRVPSQRLDLAQLWEHPWLRA